MPPKETMSKDVRPCPLPTRSPRASAFAAGVLMCLALAWPLPAQAGPDPVAGGTTTLTLDLPKGVAAKGLGQVTVSGDTATLANTGGNLDPISGAGNVKTSGELRLKAKGGKAKLLKAEFLFGPSGAVNARIKDEPVQIATLTGGDVVREGYGARITGATATVTAAGAKTLNKQLTKNVKSGGKGKAVASKRKGGKRFFKQGDVLASVSTLTIPATVEVLPEGSAELAPDPGFAVKLQAKGVFLLGGTTAIPPAVMKLPADFEFPVVGGSVAPDLSQGQVVTGGGLNVQKTIGVNSACDAHRPIGTFITQAELSPDFGYQSLTATANASTGGIGRAGIAFMDLSGATFDPATNTIQISDAVITLTPVSASVLNHVFGSSAYGCGSPSSDFVEGDVLGHMSLTAKIR